MPYEYLLNPHLASDFCTIRSVAGRRPSSDLKGIAAASPPRGAGQSLFTFPLVGRVIA